MADAAFDTKRLLALRKLTRSVADLLRGELREYLATLSPLLWPRMVFGSQLDGVGARESVRGAEANFKELQTLYETLAGGKPYNLPKELKAPVTVLSVAPELAPVEYLHQAKDGAMSKNITVTSPLRWVLSYGGYGAKRLPEVLETRAGTKEVAEVVLHVLLLHFVLTRQPGIVRILEGLRFPVSSGRLPGLGELPVMFVSALVQTIRPPDDVLIENTEVSGTDAFEEVVDGKAVAALADPLRQKLEGVFEQHGMSLVTG
jgi:hypothetical protein